MPNRKGLTDAKWESSNVRKPCYGLMMFRHPENGAAIIRLHYSANPDLTPRDLDSYRAKFPTEALWRQEMEIDAQATQGQLVFPEFDAAVHTVAPEDIPKRLTRYMAVDPHPRTPWYAAWLGVDNHGDVWVYREMFPSRQRGRKQLLRDNEDDNQYTTREYAETIAQMEGNKIVWKNEHTDHEYGQYARQKDGEYIVYRLMDQAAKGFKVSGEGQQVETIATRLADCGLVFQDPYKIHKAGEDAIRQWLRLRTAIDGKLWPRVHISRECVELIHELSTMRYQPTRGNLELRELKQEMREARRHGVDVLRYLATADLTYIGNCVS